MTHAPTVGISISDPPDREKLGFPAPEIDRALFSICTALVRHGWDIVYAGDLSPEGYTFKIFRHLAGAYASSREAPFIHLIPEPVLRRTRYNQLFSALRESRGTARTRLSVGGAIYDIRPADNGLVMSTENGRPRALSGPDFNEWLRDQPVAEFAAAFSEARRKAIAMSDARIALGGKMGVEAKENDRFEGAMPGVVEEGILTLEAGKPLILLGAFGGATRDMAIALGLIPPHKMVPRGPQQAGYDRALRRLQALRTRIPQQQLAPLKELAVDDRTEPLAFKITDVLTGWLQQSR